MLLIIVLLLTPVAFTDFDQGISGGAAYCIERLVTVFDEIGIRSASADLGKTYGDA